MAAETPRPWRRPEAFEDGLDELARRYRSALVRYFQKRIRETADVEDLVQDVFARVARRADGEDIRNPEAYLMNAAANVWRDFLRRRATHAHNAHDVYDDDRHGQAAFSPERVLEGRQSVDVVLRVIDEMPKRTREVFVLCRIEGMKHRHVARRLGISISAVEKSMMRAIAHLADRLGDGP